MMSSVAPIDPLPEPLSLAGLHRDHYRSLVRLASLLVDDVDTCEEIVQDAFVNVWRRRDRLDDQTRIPAYLRSAVLNGARSTLRRRVVRRRHLEAAPDPTPSAETAALADHEAARVLVALRGLPERQREAIARRTEDLHPTPGSLSEIERRLGDAQADERPGRRRVLLGIAASILVLLAAVAVLADREDRPERVSTQAPASTDPTSGHDDTTPSSGTTDSNATTAPTATVTATTAVPQTATSVGPVVPTVPTATTPITPTPSSTAVWPRPGDGRRYVDPIEAAGAFAREVADFTDPVIDGLVATSPTTATVTVRPKAASGATTIGTIRLVRSGDTWWVVDARTPDIVPNTPTAGSVVVCDGTDFSLGGTALAFEGHVNVEVIGFSRTDGAPLRLGRSVVMGAGTPPAQPFSGGVSCDLNGATSSGLLAFSTRSAKDGTVAQFAAIPVRFVVG